MCAFCVFDLMEGRKPEWVPLMDLQGGRALCTDEQELLCSGSSSGRRCCPVVNVLNL